MKLLYELKINDVFLIKETRFDPFPKVAEYRTGKLQETLIVITIVNLGCTPPKHTLQKSLRILSPKLFLRLLEFFWV
jgi:hypothetical protein